MQEAGKEAVSNLRPEQVDLSLLMDVPLQVTVELGRARITIENLLKLAQGSVVELNQTISEPLDILVNDKLMARGEAVVVKDKFAIRIVDVVSQERRIENLR
ncbi:MAG TPA: flagellar motor switch protein FliN [Candidatus Binatia bacterium]|jgi:flagellar motor switch protein FliN/FliY